MIAYTRHLIKSNSYIKQALTQLNELAADAILFVVDAEDRLIGSLTDGDVRRGLLKGLTMESRVDEFIQPNPKYIVKGRYTLEEVISHRTKGFRIIPVVNQSKQILNVLNFRFNKSYLPVDAVLMAGGRGERLKPLTDRTPKPLLKIGDKPIIEHNIDRLATYGIDDIHVSLRYLGGQIQDYFKDGSSKNVRIRYVFEEEPLGTIGALSLIDNFEHDIILVSNSDILTTLDYEEFVFNFIKNDADMSVVTIPYSVKIPYAVLETNNNSILSFREKPSYTYYSNGGIYLLKREVLKYVKYNSFYNATDLMEDLLAKKKNVISFPLVGYWLDIGNPEDFKKAQDDITHLKL